MSGPNVIGDFCRILRSDAKARKVTLHATRIDGTSSVGFVLTDYDGTEYRLNADQVVPIIALFAGNESAG